MLSFGLLICFFVFTRENIESLSAPAAFHEGFTLALFTSLLQRMLFTRTNTIFTASVIVLRFLLIHPTNAPHVVINILLEIANVLMTYYVEEGLRNQVKTTINYRRDLAKFKTLLTSHLPENIVILSRNLDRKYLVTNSFTTSFKAETLGQIKNFLSGLTMNLNTFNQSSIFHTKDVSLSASLKQPTLLDYLNYLKHDSSNSDHITSFNAEHRNEKDQKLSYEVKIFHLDWDGSPAVTIILDDLSQQETILSLKLADENKDKVLATVSHELRTPIHGMLGITQIIEQEFEDPKLLSYCKTAKVCAKMLLNLVNSILDLSQIRSNCIQLKPTQFKLEDMFEEIKSIFQPQFSSKTVDFRMELDENLPPKIISDRNRLTQVIVNLLANALKFTFKGEVVLKAEHNEREDLINFNVRDTGVGIKDKDKPKLFKMYGRLQHMDSTLNSQGVGLGLTISNSLVGLLNPKSQNKNIEVMSVVDEGTTFSFSISTRLEDNPNETLDEEDDAIQPRNILGQFQMRKHLSCYSQSMAEFERDEGNNLRKSTYALSPDFASIHSSKTFKMKETDKSSTGVTKGLLDTSIQSN